VQRVVRAYDRYQEAIGAKQLSLRLELNADRGVEAPPATIENAAG
jgi:hypothetical protein